MPTPIESEAALYGLSTPDYQQAIADATAFSTQVYGAPTQTTQPDKLSLEERAARKAARLAYKGEEDFLGAYRAEDFYDADTVDSIRLGNRLSGKELYANAPERTKYGAQSPDYLASRIALSRYAQGLPAESKDFYDELRSDPAKLAKYQTDLNKVKGDLLNVVGTAGVVDETHGRQVGQVYNPNLQGESLQDRLIATGTAAMYDTGVEKTRAGNLADALQYGLGRAAAGIADAFVDTATWMVKKGYQGFTGADEKEATDWINTNASLFSRDEKGDFVGLDDYGEAEMYGYDNTRTKEVTANLGKAFESGSTADMAAAVLDGVLTAGPEFFLESAGEMAAALTGAGVVAIAGKYSNEIMEERLANLPEGETLSMGDRAFATVIGAGVSLFNKLGADEILGNTKVVKSAMKLIGKPGGDTAAKQILSTLALKATETTGKGVYEGLEEVAQEILQKVGEKYGTEAQDELMSSETGKELFQAFGGGFAGGATPGAVVAAKDVAKPFVATGAFADAVTKAGEVAEDVKETVGKGVDIVKDVVKGPQASEEFEAKAEISRKTIMDSPEFQAATPEKQAEVMARFDAKYEEAKKANITELKKQKEAEGESLSTADTIVEEEVVPSTKTADTVQAEIDIAAEEQQVFDVEEATANTAQVDQGLGAFDEGYATILETLSKPITDITEAGEELGKIGETVPAEQKAKYAKGTAANAAKTIQQLTTLRDQVVEAGAGPKATEAMDNKIAKLIPLTAAQTVEELSGILNDKEVTNTQKVRSVLGSSAADIAQVEEAIALDNITAKDKKLLEAKLEVLKTYKTVSAEKLVGGGNKPGVFQWLSVLGDNASLNESAVENIKAFINGQERKLKAYEAAKAKYEANGDGKSVRVAYGEKNVYKGAATDRLIEIIREENKSVKSLADFLPDAVEEAPAVKPEPVKKAETKTEPKVTPKKPKEAPKAPESKILPTVDQVVNKIVEGKKLTKDDLQVQANEGKAIEAMLKKVQKTEKPTKEVIEPTIEVEEEMPLDIDEEAQFDMGEDVVFDEDMQEPVYEDMPEVEMDEAAIDAIAAEMDTEEVPTVSKTIAKEAKKAKTAKTVKASITEALDAAVKALPKFTGGVATRIEKIKASNNLEDLNKLISQVKDNEKIKEAVVYLQKAADSIVELKEKFTPKKGEITSINKLAIRMDINELGSELSELYAEQDVLDGDDLAKVERQIEKISNKIKKLLGKLGLEGTVGDRLLTNIPRAKKADLRADETPTMLADYFEAKVVGNSLNYSEDPFGKDFQDLVDNVEVAEGEETYFEGAKKQTVDMIEAIEKLVAEDFDHSGIADIDVKEKTAVNRFQSISRLLLKGAPKGTYQPDIDAGRTSKEGYTLPKEVSTAIALASNDWLVNEAAIRAEMRTDDDIRRLLSKAPSEDISKEERERVADIDGFMSNAATSIGGVVYKNLGLRVTAKEGENRELLEGKLKTELGLIAIAAMEKDGRITITKKTGEEIFGKGNDTTGGKGVNVFKFSEKGAELVDNRTLLFAPNSRFANKILGTETNQRTPKFEAPKAPRTIKNSSESGEIFTVAQESQDALNAQEAQSWEFDTDYVDSYKEMVKTEKGKQRLRVLLGWKDPDKTHVEQRASVNGKNLQIESNMQYLEELDAQMKAEENTKMWFPYKFVKNGRFILDTNTFNPQAKKLHRFAVFAKEVVVEKKHETLHNLALAMAFGADIDKRSNKTSLKTWADIKVHLNQKIDGGMSDLDILEDLNKGIEVFDHKNGKDTTDMIHPHDMEHAMAGIVEYRRYKAQVEKTGSSVGMKSRLPLETDAITSGYILKTMQLPLLGYDENNDITTVENALSKGGVFTEDSEYQNYGEQAESEGYTDAYNTPADVMTKKMEPVTKELLAGASEEHVLAQKRATELAFKAKVDGAIDTISRNFMKAPFMTFNYGSGLTNIINAVGNVAVYGDSLTGVPGLYGMMAKGGDDLKQVIEIVRASGVTFRQEDGKWVPAQVNKKHVAEAEAFAKALETANAKQILDMKIPQNIIDNVQANISAGAGVALEQTFNETYGVYIEAGNNINASFTAMFRLFKIKVDAAVKAKQLELGKEGKKRHLTSAETNEIIKELSESAPAIKLALSEEVSDKLMIYKTESTFYDSLDGEVVDNGQGRLKLGIKGEDGKRKELSSQSKAYQLIEAASSGAVVPIHYLDGSIQTIVANEGYAALGIHDAWMFNIDEGMAGTKTYNEGTARVSTEYSLTEAIVSGLNESINKATPEEIAQLDADYLAEVDGDIDKATSLNTIHTDIANLHFRAENAREQLFDQPLRFEHSALEGSGYDRPAGYTRIDVSTPLDSATKGEIKGEAKKEDPVKPKEEVGYNAETKKALLTFLRKPVIAKKLKDNNIDLKDC